MNNENIEEKFFTDKISDGERAAFELGIKLGALFHIAIGIPISTDESVIKTIENALQSSISCQPYVKSVDIDISLKKASSKKKHQFDYSSISPENISASVNVEYKNVIIEGKLEWNDELKFPLMYISNIHKI